MYPDEFQRLMYIICSICAATGLILKFQPEKSQDISIIIDNENSCHLNDSH